MGLSNAQYEAIRRVYTQRQLDEENALRVRTAEVYEKIPEIREISDTISRMAVASAKRLIAGDPGPAAGLGGRIAELREKKRSLLAAHGYPEDYLEPQYICPDCRDTGYVNGEKCHCFREKEISLLYDQSNLREMLKVQNFDNFDLSLFDDTAPDPRTGRTVRQYMRDVEKMCRVYVAGFPKEHGSLLFTGKTGLGKTYLSCCIARELLDQCFSVIYLPAAQMFDIFSREKFGSQDGEDPALARSRSEFLRECDLLIIDDLGTELVNTFTVTQLFAVINGRLVNRKGTIISTNLSTNEMRDEFTDRIMSRIISGYRMIPLYGDDVRIRRKMRALR
jgi:DNA replication protein DnaC